MQEQSPEPRTRLRTIIVFSMLFAIFGAVVLLAYFATFNRPVTTVILVRHAEKVTSDPNNKNPDLTDAGRARAQELARVLKDVGVTAIYATQYGRTQQTAQPLANALSLPVNQIEATQTAQLISEITSKHRGGVVFVVGHNNTVPQVVNILSGENYQTIPESDYDNMFVVTIYRTGKAKVLRLHYGSSAQATGDQGMMMK
jgi:broad specificity phosphatase PhoE